jgi:hypothetical protein
MTNVAMIEKPDHTYVSVRFAYDPDAIAILKDTVPSALRSYDPPTKTWSVHNTYGNRLAEALIAAGHTITDTDAPPPPPKPSVYSPGIGGFFGIDDADDGYDATATAAAILESIPTQHRGKVLRAMAKAMFPDLYPRPPR